MSAFTASRRAVLAGAAATALVRPAAARGREDGPWAIELFTSQGCSSCPAADAQLGILRTRPDIVALSFHVDYWDYIGWKDPFATREMTDRQRTYARVLRQRYVYTPEMVVDGITHEPGTSRDSIEEMLEAARHQSPQRATPQLTRVMDGPLTIKLAPFAFEGDPAEIILAVYDPRHATPVPRGENTGRTLDNFNVVRRLETVAKWKGTAASWTVPADRFKAGQGIAVLVQHADQGAMLGCNKLEPNVTG
ncbi:MAG: DUF1223 domain-containing protein [Proteobacteria bacterium]|nr:DUF1223 domain-containing protein [Pseudomonadota bacterium]